MPPTDRRGHGRPDANHYGDQLRMDTGLFILRAVVGLLLVGYGTQKLFGWFDGDGPRGHAAWLASLGFRPALPLAILNGLAEAGGGALLALGLATPAAAAILVANFVAAYSNHAGKGVWNANGGWELPLLYGTVAATLGLTGAGDASLDAVLGWDLAGAEWGAAALAAGAIAGIAALLSRRRAARALAAQSAA